MTEQERQEFTALLDQLTMPQLEMVVKMLELVEGGTNVYEAARLAGITA